MPFNNHYDMEYLKYKDYFGPITFSEEEHCYFGEVEGLQHATILYEGDTVEELKADFEAGIDDYLNYCEERDITPEKPNLWHLTVFMPLELRSRVASLAEQSGESINAFITRIARREVENASV